ncbi:MAG TPA: NfeD family protein [Bacillota bacterium]|jgi:membrane protein implicated in regulation of membrane protease activity|nr:NfeD family protein [Fastidiosipila sp.]HPX92829.1 NfeD family protein [Bacillota bacterium]HQB81314.1 NfeD family protein [Bacillota bacterium]
MNPLILETVILGLSAALFWGLIMAAAAVAELATLNLVSIWFVAAALIAMIAALLGASLTVQFVLFAACSIGGFLIFILLIRPKLGKRLITPTNADRIMNKEGVVTDAINPTSGGGLIRVEGQVWSARTEDETFIPKGTPVRVIGLRGVKAIVVPVEPLESEQEPEP